MMGKDNPKSSDNVGVISTKDTELSLDEHGQKRSSVAVDDQVQDVDPKEERQFNNAYVSGMKEDLSLHGNELNYFTTYFKYIYGLRFLIGFFEGTAWPAYYTIISQWYLPHEVALRMSIYNIAQPAGAMLSGAMQGALSTNLEGVLGRSGWRWAFLINPERQNPLSKFYLKPRHIEIAHARARRVNRRPQVGITVKSFLRCFTFWQLWAIASDSVAMLNYLPIVGQAIQLVAELLFSGFSDLLGQRLPFLLLHSVINITSLAILIIRPANQHAYMAGWYMNYIGAVSLMLLCAWGATHLQHEPEVRTVMFASGTVLAYLLNAFVPIAVYPASEAPHWRIGAKLYMGFAILSTFMFVGIHFGFKWDDKRQSKRAAGSRVVVEEEEDNGNNEEQHVLRLPVLIDFHGGSFILGTPQEQAPFCAQMARELGTSDPGGGCVVISVDYRLGPYAQYPAANEDAEDILRAVLEPSTLPGKIILDAVRQKVRRQLDRDDQVHLDPSRVALSGFSSGGNLALGLAISVANDPTIHRDWPSVIPPDFPRGIPLLLFYPSLDSRLLPDERPRPPGLDPPTGFFSRLQIESELMPKYMPVSQRGHPRASPGLAPLEGLHPRARIMLVLPELDSLSEQSMAWIEKLAQEGRSADLDVVQVPGVMHGWTQFPDSWLKSDDERAKKAMVFDTARRFVQQVWNSGTFGAGSMEELRRATESHRSDAASPFQPYGSNPRTSFGGTGTGRADNRPATPNFGPSGRYSSSSYPSPPSTPNGDRLPNRRSYSALANQNAVYEKKFEKYQAELRDAKQEQQKTKDALDESQEQNARLQTRVDELDKLNAEAKQEIKDLRTSLEEACIDAVRLCQEEEKYLDAAKYLCKLADLKLHEAEVFDSCNDLAAADKAENSALNFEQQRGEMLMLDDYHLRAELVFRNILGRREQLYGADHIKRYKESRVALLSLAHALRKQHDVNKTMEAERLYEPHASLVAIDRQCERSREWAFCNAIALAGALYERQAYACAKHRLSLIWEARSKVPAGYASELGAEVLKILHLLRGRVDLGHKDHFIDALTVICKPDPAELSPLLLNCYIELGTLLSEQTGVARSANNCLHEALGYLQDAWRCQDRLSVKQGRNTLWTMALVWASLGEWKLVKQRLEELCNFDLDHNHDPGASDSAPSSSSPPTQDMISALTACLQLNAGEFRSAAETATPLVVVTCDASNINNSDIIAIATENLLSPHTHLHQTDTLLKALIKRRERKSFEKAKEILEHVYNAAKRGGMTNIDEIKMFAATARSLADEWMAARRNSGTNLTSPGKITTMANEMDQWASARARAAPGI
ncbi:hypothetical protein DV738_g376, partial [Chaetothyriales sp. CBS 135597]